MLDEGIEFDRLIWLCTLDKAWQRLKSNIHVSVLTHTYKYRFRWHAALATEEERPNWIYQRLGRLPNHLLIAQQYHQKRCVKQVLTSAQERLGFLCRCGQLDSTLRLADANTRASRVVVPVAHAGAVYTNTHLQTSERCEH
jgi:hypothetical protein